MTQRFETWGRLDLGDHALGAQRDDPARMGFIEVSDRLRFVPQEGEEWSFPLSEVVVRTKKRWPNRPTQGVEIDLPGHEGVRLRATSYRPGTPLTAQQSALTSAAAAGRLLTALIKHGARYEPRS